MLSDARRSFFLFLARAHAKIRAKIGEKNETKITSIHKGPRHTYHWNEQTGRMFRCEELPADLPADYFFR